jgi:hypothetical protein
VQALRMENGAPVVGPAAPTANSEMVEPDIATADWSRPNFRFAHDPAAATRLAVTSDLSVLMRATLPRWPFGANSEVAGGCGIDLTFVRVADLRPLPRKLNTTPSGAINPNTAI